MNDMRLSKYDSELFKGTTQYCHHLSSNLDYFLSPVEHKMRCLESVLCLTEERKSYRFGVNDDKTFRVSLKMKLI